MTSPRRFCILLLLSTQPLLGEGPIARIWNPDRIHWTEVNRDGSKYAVLEGDRSKPGPFTYAFFLPDGVWEAPHSHTGDARVAVVSGTMLLGDGARRKAEPVDKARPL